MANGNNNPIPTPDSGPNLEQQVQFLNSELQDAYLVIGKQQVMMLRMEQIMKSMQGQMSMPTPTGGETEVEVEIEERA